MPPYVKNTGMSSLNELFAMKKNLAFETKFEHRLSSMVKDFFHKKENLKQDIRAVYNDLRSIKLSTGYSLNEAESARSADRLCKRPSVPTIYLPPVGIRLVQKYIGVDVRRQSLKGEHSQGRQQQTLDRILNQTIGLVKTDSKDTACTVKETKVEESLVGRNAEVTKAEHHKKSVLKKQSVKTDNEKAAQIFPDITDNQVCRNSFIERNERPLDDNTVLKPSENFQQENTISDSEEVSHLKDADNTIHNLIDGKEKPKNDEEKTLLDTDYNLTERRSSRSTFRGRSSTRLPSQSSALSKYNLGVAGISKGNKSNIGNFYLDYGDGKLHDPMEIPKVKDCSRPWCNPHCKTCRNRTYSRPCFVLIPAEENVRKRQIPQDKRRPSMFPKYLGSQMKDQTDNFQSGDKNNANSSPFQKESSNILDTLRKENDHITENKEFTNELMVKEDECKDDKSDECISATAYFNPNIEKKRNGYSKKRMSELAMPRGGPPAEVRFSKMSLRKKQDQLIEDERKKALTAYECENLTQIQGKISMFLALLNQQELMGKPVKMVDIPVRMDAINTDASKIQKGKRKRLRNVHFSSRPRLLS